MRCILLVLLVALALVDIAHAQFGFGGMPMGMGMGGMGMGPYGGMGGGPYGGMGGMGYGGGGGWRRRMMGGMMNPYMEKFALFGMILTFLMAPMVVKCGKKNKPRKASTMSRNSTKPGKSKISQKSQKKETTKTKEKTEITKNKSKKSKKLEKSEKKVDTMETAEEKSKKSTKKFTVPNSPMVKEDLPTESPVGAPPTPPPMYNGIPTWAVPQAPSPKGADFSLPTNPIQPEEYQLPPVEQRPKHPGFESMVEHTDENKTVRQVAKFPDAQDFV